MNTNLYVQNKVIHSKTLASCFVNLMMILIMMENVKKKNPKKDAVTITNQFVQRINKLTEIFAY